MATSAIATSMPGPEPYLQHPGSPPMPYNLWKLCYDNYLNSISGTTWSDSRKSSTLLSKAGIEAQRQYYAQYPVDPGVPEPTYTEVQARFVKLFCPKVNRIVDIYNFLQRRQLPGESLKDFQSALKKLAVPCQLGTLEPILILVMLVIGTYISRIRERLLMEDDLTLEKGLTLGTQIEMAIRDAQSLNKPSQSANKTNTRYSKSVNQYKSRSQTQNEPAQSCFNCGRARHKSIQDCPARGKICASCGRLNHFASVRRSKSQKTSAQYLPPRPSQQPHRIQGQRRQQPLRHVDQFAPQEPIDELQVLTVCSVSNASVQHIPCSLRLFDHTSGLNKRFRFIYDPGSLISTLPVEWFKINFPETPLVEPPVNLLNYDQSKIEVCGSAYLTCSRNNHTVNSMFYVVKAPTGLLGLDIIRALHISLNADTLTLSETQTTPTIDTLKAKFPKLFSPHLGQAKGFVHRIQLKPGAVPVQKKKKPVPLALRTVVAEELKRLTNDGVIEPINASEWSHPMSIVEKPDGRVRVTCDLRELNPHVIADTYPLPKIEECFPQIQNASVVSTLDLSKAFFQMCLAPESRGLTAFLTEQGIFQYCRLPMGLKSSPSAYQKMMDTITADLQGVLCYIDDILIWGKDHQEHNNNLYALCERLEQYNMRLEPTKCVIANDKAKFLGHMVGKNGIESLEKNTSAITNDPRPTTYKALHAFLGSCSFNLRFLPNFSMLSEPLWSKLRGKEKSDAYITDWSEADQKSFDDIKQLMCKPPVLGYFRSGCPTFVVTDASDYGLGATLCQRQEGKIRLIRSISHTLTDTERKYSIGEKECLACVWACERWHFYLYGRPFTLVTDHKALQTLLDRSSVGRKPARIARWYERLSRHDYTPIYRSDDINRTADFLSRLPVKATQPVSDTHDFILANVHISLAKMSSLTAKDPALSKIKQYLVKGWPETLPIELKPYSQIKDELSIWNDCVLRGEYRMIVPASAQGDLLKIAHESHPGATKMKQKLREAYWWPSMDRHVEEFVKSCIPCDQSDKSKKPVNYPGEPITASEPWETLCIDIQGPYDTATQRYLIVLIDVYSKWVEAAATQSVTSKNMVEFLETIFSRFGLPKRIISDNGSQFISAEFETYLQKLNIKHTRTALYNPQGNSPVERANKWIKEGLQVATLAGTSWKKALSSLLTNYRATPQGSTGVSPAELLFGRRIRTKLHLPEMKREPARIKPILDRQATVRQLIHRNFPFAVGKYARHKLPQVGKGRPSYSRPLRIVDSKGPYTLVLEDGSIWNARKLCPCSPKVVPLEPEQYPSVYEPAAATPRGGPTAHGPRPMLQPPLMHQDLPVQPMPLQPRRSNRGRIQHQLYQHFPDHKTQGRYQANRIFWKGKNVVTSLYYKNA